MNADSKFKTRLNAPDPKTDMIPFVGTLFLLIMFFSVTVTTVQVSGIKINLPSSKLTDDIFTERCVVTVDKDGKVFWNDRIISDIRTDLGAEFNRLKGEDANPDFPGGERRRTVVLRCDTRSEYKVPMQVMALAFSNDINVIVALSPEKKSETDYDTPSAESDSAKPADGEK